MVKIPFRRNPAALIFFAYVALVGVHLGCGTFLGFERYRESRTFTLQHVMRMSHSLVKEGRAHELAKYLSDAQSTGLIDFYELTSKGHTDTGGTTPTSRPILSEPVSELNGWAWGRADSAGLSLRLASGFGYSFRFRAAATSELERLPADLFFALFACAVALLFSAPAAGLALGRESRRAKVIRQEAAKKTGQVGDFTGVCGRAALLNLAELAGGDQSVEFFASLDEFYADAAAILNRYRGHLQGAHGHELLFYFTEKDSALDRQLAAAASRDLVALAERRGLRLAAVLSYGRLHGVHLLSGFAFLGAPVEEAGELLLRVGSQREAGVFMADSFAQQSGSATSTKRGLRPLPAAQPFATALQAARGGDATSLAFHRGDEALAELLLSLSGGGWENEAYVGIVGQLRLVNCRRCGPGVVEAYRGLLAGELARKDSYRLSSAVALATTLLSRSQIDRALEKLFLQCATLKDRRVRANAVEIFTKFFPEREIPELRPLIRDEDNRVSANALIKAACERFDEKVIARLDDRVRGGSVAHVASALHAMGEIALYYRRHDPLFLGSKGSFLRLFESVPFLATHPNSMIRRQALIAAHKLESELVDARMRQLFDKCVDPELVGLFHSIYGWKREQARAAA